MQAFPVSELAHRTGVKVPTIHAYLRQGLLPAPVRVADNRFLYDRRHVEALGLIRLLRERRHLPIETIKELLPTLLGVEGEEEHAFRSGMWEEVLGRYFPDDGPSSPQATLTAAARAIFARRGYAETSIDEICARAGIAKGTFYRAFASKDDVYLAAAESVAGAVLDAVATTQAPVPVDDLAKALAPYAGLLLEVASRALLGEPGHGGVVPGVVDRIADGLARRQRGGGRGSRRAVEAAMARVVGEAIGLHA
ncbi:MAG TPA: TetR family transcriptional regulator [Acidimicrobiales bacterium]|nr:TetR family transcriptional regulator [Acidimicrobiales bacterium]